MSNSDNATAGCIVFIIGIIPIITWAGTGYIAWKWVEPTNFSGAIIFILAWGVLGYIAKFLFSLILAAIME